MTQTPANWATVSRPSLLTFWLLKSETEQRQSELRIATLRHPPLTAQVSTLDPIPDLCAGTWCKLGKHDPTGNHLALEKVNSAKDSFLLTVSVNIKPFSGVTNFYITVIVCMFWTLICSILPIFPLICWLADPWNVGRSFLQCVAFYLEFLCPVHLTKLLWRCEMCNWRVCDWVMSDASEHWPGPKFGGYLVFPAVKVWTC